MVAIRAGRARAQFGHWLERFAATGISPVEVDFVFCLHLHLT